MSSGSSSPSASGPPTEGPKAKRFMNGWSKEQDALMADWSDIAGCYRWLHDKAEKQYTLRNMRMTIPVIILSTLTGTASVGISSLANGDEQIQKYMNFGIGGVSLIAAILTTLNNFLRYAQLSESNRVAGVSWGKFQRLIAVELALNPNERMDSLDFLKICRAELDRLIEQSPAIPDAIIQAFETEFKDNKKLRRPDICHGLDHTRVFDSSQSRLKNMTSDAAMMLLQKKKALKNEIVPELDRMIASAVAATTEATKKELEEKLAEVAAAAAAATPVLLPKPSMSSLFKASEVDFATVLEQRRAAVLKAAKPARKMPSEDIYIDFSKTSPAAAAAFVPAPAPVDELIPDAVVVVEPEEEKK
jgi:hypothetical protein